MNILNDIARPDILARRTDVKSSSVDIAKPDLLTKRTDVKSLGQNTYLHDLVRPDLLTRRTDVKSLSVDLNDITKPAIVRLARRAGVKSLNKLVYDEIRDHIKLMLEKWLSNIVEYAEYNRKKTINVNELVSGIPHKYFSKPVSDRMCKKGNLSDSKSEIQHYQALSGCLMIPRLPFARLAKAIASQYKSGIRMSKDAIVLLQHCIENCVIEMLNNANLMSMHAGREKVQPKDIMLYLNAKKGGHCGVGGLSAASPEFDFKRFIGIMMKKLFSDVKIMKINKIVTSQLNQFLNLLISAICEKAKFLNQKKKVKTISTRTVQSAVRIIVPNGLDKYADNSGIQAILKYTKSKDSSKERKGTQARAGLVLPVSRVSKFFKKYNTRVNLLSSIYLTAVVEYITATIMADSGDFAVRNGKKMLDSRHLMIGIDRDDEYRELAESLCFGVVDGGVIPT